MAGKIRTKEKCPKCGGKFLPVGTDKGTGVPLQCPTCLTRPQKYFIDIYVKGYGRLKIYSDHKGRTLDSFASAERTLVRIRSEIDDHTFDPTQYCKAELKKFLFETRIEEWYRDKLLQQQKGHLAESYVKKLKCYKDSYYLKFFKGMDVREIRTFHINEFYKWLPTLSPKYTHNIFSALQNFFNTLCIEGYISFAQRPSFPKIQLDRKTPRWIDRDTQLTLIKSIPEHDRPIFLFLAFQGVRPGEARALKVKDIDFRNECLTIRRTFSGNTLKERVKSRIIKPRAINPLLIPLLQELCRDKTPDAFIFINPRTGKPYDKNALQRIWNKAITGSDGTKKIDITLYQATRHSLASNLLNNGAELSAIRDILGHSDIRTTLIYANGDLNSQRIAFNQSQTSILDMVKPLCPQTVPKAKI